MIKTSRQVVIFICRQWTNILIRLKLLIGCTNRTDWQTYYHITLDPELLFLYFIISWAELIGFSPSNQDTLYLLCLFYSDNEIITVCCRPEICTLIGWIETSRLCLSFSKVSLVSPKKHLDRKGSYEASVICQYVCQSILFHCA